MTYAADVVGPNGEVVALFDVRRVRSSVRISLDSYVALWRLEDNAGLARTHVDSRWTQTKCC